MGAPDVATKAFMMRPDVFVDAFNAGILGGEQVLSADCLEEMDSVVDALLPQVTGKVRWGKRRGSNWKKNAAQSSEESSFMKCVARPPRSTAFVRRIRDLLRRVVIRRGREATYILLGIEDQSYVDYIMPVRIMLYDALSYYVEIRMQADKEDWDNATRDSFLSGAMPNVKIAPVVTLVVFFSPDEWNGPRALSAMFDKVDERIRPFVQDYKIFVLAASELEKTDRTKFKSDLGDVLYAIKLAKDKEAFVSFLQESERMRHLSSEGRAVMRETTHTEFKEKQDEEGKGMYYVWDEIVSDAEKKGLKLGIEQGIEQGIERGIEQGIERGKKEGKIEGIFESQLNMIRKLKDSFKWTLEQAMEFLAIPSAGRGFYLKALAQ